MKTEAHACTAHELPELTRVVLQQLAKLRSAGDIAPQDFERKIGRVMREDLEPHGLQLLVRDLPEGRTRFLIKEVRSGKVREMIDWTPAQMPRDRSCEENVVEPWPEEASQKQDFL